MQTLLTFINTGLSIFLAYLAYKRYQSTILSILVIIAAYAFLRAFAQVFLMYYYRIKAKVHPMPVIHQVKTEHWEDKEEWTESYRNYGMRVMVVTEELNGDEYPDLVLEMERKTIEGLNKPNTIFNLRYERVVERDYPYQLVWSNCGEGGSAINDCVKAWYNSWALQKMTARQRDKDFYVYDGTIDVPGKGEKLFTGFVLYDGGLPVTLNNPYLKKKEELEAPAETESPAETEAAPAEAEEAPSEEQKQE